MRIGKQINMLLTVSVFVFFSNSPASAYDDAVTHPAITEKAISVSNLDSYLRKEFVSLFDAGVSTTLNGIPVLDWLTRGSTAEDSPLCRASNHFHDPLKSWDTSYMTDVPAINSYCSQIEGWTEHYSNVTWGTGYQAPSPEGAKQTFTLPSDKAPNNWDSARTHFYSALTSDWGTYRNIEFVNTFQALGQVMHLLQDMAVPAHVRNDFQSHLEVNNYRPGESPKNWFNNAYELYVKKNTKSLVKNSDAGIINSAKASFISPRLTDFWDTNQYNNNSEYPTAANLGLAEFTNLNYLSDDTIPTDIQTRYLFPRKANIFDYRVCNDLIPASEGTALSLLRKRKYLSRVSAGDCPEPTTGRRADHFAAVTFWSAVAATLDPLSSPYITKLELFLDDNVHNTYAKELIPRAIGYSAALVDYFFRGSLEISVPDNCLYALIDGSQISDVNGTQQQTFAKVKAKIQNTSYIKDQAGNNIGIEEIKSGTLQAIAKYKKRTDYLPDLANDPPTFYPPENSSVEPFFSYSVSAIVDLTPEDIAAINSGAKEFTFNFTDSPIPAGITDLYLQVVFKGTLGNEADNAIAVGFKDLSEPTHLNFFNTTDYTYQNGQLRPAYEYEKVTISEKIAFCPSSGWPPTDVNEYQANYVMAPGQFARLIFISEPNIQIFYGSMDVQVNVSNPIVADGWYLPWTTVYQDSVVGLNTNVYEFRGKFFHDASAFSSYSDTTDVGFWFANWPAITADPVAIGGGLNW